MSPTYRCGCPAAWSDALTAPHVLCRRHASPAPAPNSDAALALASLAGTDYLDRRGRSRGDARHTQAAKRRALQNEAPEGM